ncbi:MAG: hypothetical protein AAF571_03090, partial [Verrucomicrobiota bacterium]
GNFIQWSVGQTQYSQIRRTSAEASYAVEQRNQKKQQGHTRSIETVIGIAGKLSGIAVWRAIA